MAACRPGPEAAGTASTWAGGAAVEEQQQRGPAPRRASADRNAARTGRARDDAVATVTAVTAATDTSVPRRVSRGQCAVVKGLKGRQPQWIGLLTSPPSPSVESRIDSPAASTLLSVSMRGECEAKAPARCRGMT